MTGEHSWVTIKLKTFLEIFRHTSTAFHESIKYTLYFLIYLVKNETKTNLRFDKNASLYFIHFLTEKNKLNILPAPPSRPAASPRLN